ncbi:MAG: hypothetical protein IT328_19870 [Caldilineaceae bacterium]|nr:hypothetical protein [Caldilineaceae bacterium]
MNKKLPTNTITNELAGSSVFFQSKTPTSPLPQLPEIDSQPTLPPELPSSQVSTRDTTISRNHDSMVARNHDVQQEITPLDEIRKAVKQLGKEAATHRFTVEEKAAIADIVYTYSRQGIRTSENELTRIAVNWLLVDYRQNGGTSVLARLLEELHG